MRLYEHTEPALFVSRPNRFQVMVRQEGEPFLAYMANPGRLNELLHPGAKLHLIESQSETAKMKKQVVAIEQEEGFFIPLNTHKANDVAEFLIREGLVPSLAEYKVKKREVKMGRSRFDFLLEDEKGEELYLEVKSCTLFSERAAQFPDAVTARGKKHLDELCELAENGVKAGALFLTPQLKSDYFLPDMHTDLAFAMSFLAAKDKLSFHPVGVSFDAESRLVGPVKELAIPWELIETNAKDEGDYLFLLELEEDISMAIGSAGVRDFQKGFYVYVGSAKKSLSKRVQRHKKQRKKLRWHLDYLRREAKHHITLPILNQDGLECQIADSLKELAPMSVSGFGSSDCDCESHLFYFAEDPLYSREFHRMLQHFRTDRHL